MKRNYTRVITLMLATILMFSGITGLLTGCQQPAVPTEGSAPGTEPTQATVPSTQATQPSAEATAPSTEDTVPDLQLPQEGTPLTEEELRFYKSLFVFQPDANAQHPINWYNRILCTQFSSPESINLRDLFYHGTDSFAHVLTEEEKSLLQAQGCQMNLDHVRIVAEDADAILEYFFRLTWDETDRVGEENMIYLPQTGCYYKAANDSFWLTEDDFTIHGGAKLEDGTIRLYYTLDYSWKDSVLCVLTMRGKLSQNETGYYFIANQPV